MRTITIETELGLKKLYKDVDKVEKRIEKLNEKLDKSKEKRDKLTQDMNDKDERYVREAEVLEEMKVQGASKGELKEQAAMVKSLYSDYNKAAGAVDRVNTSIADDTAELEKLTNKSEEYKQQITEIETEIAKNNKGLHLFSKAAETADEVFADIGKRLKTMAKRVLVMSVFLRMFRAIKSYLTQAVMQNDEAARSVNQLKGAFQTMAQPLISLIIPAVITLVGWLTKLVTTINMLLARLTGKSLSAMQKAAKSLNKAAGGGGNNKSMASFDTINQLSGGSGGSPADQLSDMYDVEELAQGEFDKMLATIGLIGAALAAWKFPVEGLSFLQNFIGYLLVIGGLLIAVKNYFDAWNNGVKLDNLLGIIGGLAIAMGGLYILFGLNGVAIGALIGAAALLVLGFKDVIANGANLANVLTVITGIVLAGLGFAILTGSWIPLVIAGIAGIVAMVVFLGGEFDGLANGVKTTFGGIIKFLKGVFTGDWELAWEGIKDIFKGIFNTILAIFGGVVNAVIKGLNWLIEKANALIGDGLISSAIGLVTGGKYKNIPTIAKWEVPYLAQGAVIPPNREFLAVLGDQKNGTNIEAPLDTIVEAFQKVSGTQNISINFTGSLAQLGKVLNPVITKENKRVGQSLVGG